MEYTTLSIEQRGPAAWLFLDRPDMRNAFDETVVTELGAALVELGERPGVRAVVLAGKGAAFCAGADLKWMARMREADPRQNLDDARAVAETLAAIDRCPRPVVARVHGAVFGGGNGLVACADVAVAAESTVFALSEVKLGLVPATISPYLVRRMGPAATRRLTLTGERFDARTARELGLVDRVVAEGELDAEVERVVGLLLTSGPAAIVAAKELYARVAEMPLEEAKPWTAEFLARVRAGAEAREGIGAFLEKRKPKWVSDGQ